MTDVAPLNPDAGEATLGHARSEARRLMAEGRYPEALRLYDHIVSAVPGDHEARLHVADLLAKVGLTEGAAALYGALAMHNVRNGHPLAALVAADALGILSASGSAATDRRRPPVESYETILDALSAAYSAGSPQLARFATRPSPPDPAQPLPPLAGPPPPFDALADASLARALDLDALPTDGQQFHPLPFLSELTRAELRAVLAAVTVKRMRDGAFIMRQGESGDALYLVAGGEVRVSGVGPDGVEHAYAHLFEHALFGEMALLTDQPRTASVMAVGEASIIEIGRSTMDALTAKLPTVAVALSRFARERLIRNLLATSPLFAPFTKAQQADLLARFEGVECAAGAVVIQQGEAGLGLYVVLSGEVEVSRVEPDRAENGSVTLARLQAGDLFGEMSLLSHQPTMATVRATRPTTVLFLDRTYFDRLIQAFPDLAQAFMDLANRRAQASTQLLLGRRALPVPTAAGGGRHPADQDEDLVLI